MVHTLDMAMAVAVAMGAIVAFTSSLLSLASDDDDDDWIGPRAHSSVRSTMGACEERSAAIGAVAVVDTGTGTGVAAIDG